MVGWYILTLLPVLGRSGLFPFRPFFLFWFFILPSGLLSRFFVLLLLLFLLLFPSWFSIFLIYYISPCIIILFLLLFMNQPQKKRKSTTTNRLPAFSSVLSHLAVCFWLSLQKKSQQQKTQIKELLLCTLFLFALIFWRWPEALSSSSFFFFYFSFLTIQSIINQSNLNCIAFRFLYYYLLTVR